MEKQDILDYVSKTPENVNVNVLGGMLDEFASSGGGSGGSTEPFFFEVEIKGIDPQSGEPIIEETSTTYNNLLSMIADGRPIYCRLIVPPELAEEVDGVIDSTKALGAADHRYNPNDPVHPHLYIALFEGMVFGATSPSDTLVSGINISGGGNGNPT